MKKDAERVPWLNKNIMGFGLASFLSDLSHEMTTLIFPLFITNLVGASLAPFYLGLISGFADAGASFMRIFFGYLSDKICRRKPFIAVGYVMSCVFIALTGFAQNIWFVFINRLLAWSGKGMREPARDALIAESTSRVYYGRAFGFHRAMDTLGALLGPLITFALLGHVNIRSIFFISFIPSFFSVVAILKLTRDKPYDQLIKNEGSIFKIFRSMPSNFLVFIMILMFFSCGFYHQTMMVLRAQELLGVNHSLLSSSMVVLLYAFFNTIRAIGEYAVGWLSDQYDRKKLLAFFGMFLFGVSSLLMSLAQAKPLLLFIFFLGGLSIGSFSALEKAYAADLLPEEIRGMGYGVLQAVRGVGGFISSFVVGLLWVSFSPTVGFLYAALISFVSVFFLIFLKESD